MKKIQVLCATMKQSDFSLIHKMNIRSDVFFANQADETRYDEIESDGHSAKMITTSTRGVGINRNFALMHADGDICLIADDDIIYDDNYVTIVNKAFEDIPDADAIIFNFISVGGDKTRIKNIRCNSKVKRVRFYNALNYGAVRLAVKNNSIKRANVYFHRSFGGGATYSAGEDTLFIWDLLKNGLKIYTYPATIATVNQETSSWFKGYNEKLLFDNGVLFRALSKKFAKLLCLQSLIRHPYTYKATGLSFYQAYKLMKQGTKAFEIGGSYSETYEK